MPYNAQEGLPKKRAVLLPGWQLPVTALTETAILGCVTPQAEANLPDSLMIASDAEIGHGCEAISNLVASLPCIHDNPKCALVSKTTFVAIWCNFLAR